MVKQSRTIYCYALVVVVLCALAVLAPTQEASAAVGPDLVVTQVAIPPTCYAGQSITVGNQVYNQGDTPTGGFLVGLYLSADTVFDGGDQLLATRVVGSLAAGGTTTENTTVNIGVATSAGTYYIIVVADITNSVAESNESNNTRSSGAMVIGKPDLRITAGSSNAGSIAGTSFTVGATINNNGGSTSGPCTLRLYLSTDGIVDAGDTVLGDYSFTSLYAQSSVYPGYSASIPVATAPGTYYLILEIDVLNVVDESNESNNVYVISSPVTISKPDLRITGASSDAGSVAGGIFYVYPTVNNNGGSQSQACTLRLYLSADTLVDVDDVVLYDHALPLVNQQSSTSPLFYAQLPVAAPPGIYYLLLEVDAADVVDESNEGNNTHTIQAVVIGKPDLVASALVGFGPVEVGQSYRYDDTFVNTGGSMSSETTVAFYLSEDTLFDESDDLLLGTRSLPALTPHSTAPDTAVSSRSTTLTVPATVPPGEYHLLAVADAPDVVDESNEANNVRSLAVTVLNTPPVADAGGPYFATEGAAVEIDGSASSDPNEPGGWIESWEWDLDGDGQFDDASGEVTEVTFPDDGEYEIRLRVTDDGGLTHEDTATVTVANSEPRVVVVPPDAATEGSQLTLDVEFGDQGLEDTHTVTVDWGDGSEESKSEPIRPAEETSGNVQPSHTYADDGTYTVTVTVADDDGGTGTDSIQVTVTNVKPTVSPVVMSDPAPVAGTLVQFSAPFTDPGSLDTHTAQWTWGDGTSGAGAVSEAGGNGTVTGSHTYAAAGTYTVTCTVTDKDGDAGTRTRQFTVTAAPCEFVPIAGADRYKTAVEASKEAYPAGASTVVIATGANWPDALGGSALAGAVDGPLLLVKPTSLPDAVVTELTRLGATDAYVLGGTAAVSQQVQDSLDAKLSGKVTRIFGPTRYATANKVADEVIRIKGGGYSGDAFVATGANFPDALGASPLAASSARPILLAKPDAAPYLPTAVKRATILGGEAAVTPATESAVRTALGSANVVRVGGKDRYDTAAKIADHGVGLGMHWDGVGIATGMAFPDALSGGAMLGRAGSVLLLTKQTSLVEVARTRLTTHKADIHSVYFIGGTAAVSQGVRDEVAKLVE